MAETGSKGENRNGLNPMEAVTKADYVVGLTRLDSGVGTSKRAKSTWDVEYSSINFFEILLEGTFRIEIEEQLDSYFRTAKVYVSDRQTMLSILPLTGNELITIRYKNALVNDTYNTQGLAPKIIHFSISNITQTTNTIEGHEKGARIIILNLVEAPAFTLLTNNTIYKTYPIESGEKGQNEKSKRNSTFSDLMEHAIMGEGSMKALSNSLINKWYDLDVESSKQGEEFKVDFYFPNWTISKTLNYLKKFAVNQKDYPYYIFFIRPPEKEGLKSKIYMKTLYSLFEETNFHTFSQTFAETFFRARSNEGEKAYDYEQEPEHFDPLNVFFDMKLNYFNIIQTAFSGLSGETFATFDYIEDNMYIGYDYSTFVETHKGLGDVSIHAFDYGNQWSNLRPHSYTEPQRLINKKRNEFAKRQLQSALSCALHCTMNHSRHIGQMVDIPLRSAVPDTFEDKTFSGRWLIWGQKDIMTMDKAYSICHLVKEGFSQETNNTVKYDKILKKFNKNLHIRKGDNSGSSGNGITGA